MENLCDLPYDMVVEIAKRLKKLEDFIFFRSVSKSFHAVVNDEYFNGLRFRQGIPYLMLHVREDSNDNTREFYNLVEGESNVASLKVPNFKTIKCFESLGWLLVVEVDGSISLLEPFSDIGIPLPHQNAFPGYKPHGIDEHIFIHKMVLSSRPSETSDFVVMVIYGGYGHLGFWRLGDKAWNMIETRSGAYADVVYGGGGQFYAISNGGIVWVFNLAENDNHVETRIIINFRSILPHFIFSGNFYILKTGDDSLLVITREIELLSDDALSYNTYDFEGYEVNIATGTWKEIDTLGSMALFLGENSTIVLDTSRFSGGVIKSNHIYFIDDNWEQYYPKKSQGGGKDIGVFNFETGVIEPIYLGEPLLSRVSPSTWIIPCF